MITVDLDRDVWDPYPNVDCHCPPGDIVMQQLVWTLDTALDSTLPVLLTINGEPARGIWVHQLDGPVSMESQSPRILQKVTVPDTVGLPSEEAQSVLMGAGFTVEQTIHTSQPSVRSVRTTVVRKDGPRAQTLGNSPFRSPWASKTTRATGSADRVTPMKHSTWVVAEPRPVYSAIVRAAHGWQRPVQPRLSARLEGTLAVNEDGCVAVGGTVVLWPSPYVLITDRADGWAIGDADGNLLAEQGQNVVLGGAMTTAEAHQALVPRASHSRCLVGRDFWTGVLEQQ